MCQRLTGHSALLGVGQGRILGRTGGFSAWIDHMGGLHSEWHDRKRRVVSLPGAD